MIFSKRTHNGERSERFPERFPDGVQHQDGHSSLILLHHGENATCRNLRGLALTTHVDFGVDHQPPVDSPSGDDFDHHGKGNSKKVLKRKEL